MRRCILILAFLVTIFYAGTTQAATSLTMYGPPHEPENFQYLDYTNPDAPKGGVLKLAKTGTFNNLNANIILGTAAEGLEMINDKLMQRAWNEPFTLYALVAEKVDITPDRSAITFHLNKKARFHDGSPMTTDDVLFSFESYKEHGHPVRRRVYSLVKKIDKIDKYTIRFSFGAGYDRESVMILAMMPVLPKHYWEKHDISKTTLESPMGSGPYKVLSIEPGRKVIYERVKDYWATDLPINRGLYNFDKIEYQYYRDDGVALEAFKGGEYYLRREYDVKKWQTGYNDIGRTVTKEDITHQRPEWLKSLIFNTRRPLFQDRRVRQALSLMFDYKWMNKVFYYDTLKPIDSIFPNSELRASGAAEGEELDVLKKNFNDLAPEVLTQAWRPSILDMRQKQKQALALFKESGWTVKNGKLVDAKGNLFNFEILLGESADEKIALQFARSLKKIGIEARVRTVDGAQFAGRLQTFDYDIVSFKWINSLSPGNEQLNYWGSAAAETEGSRNYAGIKNKAIDVIASSIAAAQSRESLIARCRALDRAVMWDFDFIPLFYSGTDRVVYNPDIGRPSQTPTYGIILESWWLNP